MGILNIFKDDYKPPISLDEARYRMNLNLPGNIVSINEKLKALDQINADLKDLASGLPEPKGEYAISTRKLLLIIFIGLWVIDCLIAAWIIFHTVCG